MSRGRVFNFYEDGEWSLDSMTEPIIINKGKQLSRLIDQSLEKNIQIKKDKKNGISRSKINGKKKKIRINRKRLLDKTVNQVHIKLKMALTKLKLLNNQKHKQMVNLKNYLNNL